DGACNPPSTAPLELLDQTAPRRRMAHSHGRIPTDQISRVVEHHCPRVIAWRGHRLCGFPAVDFGVETQDVAERRLFCLRFSAEDVDRPTVRGSSGRAARLD